MRTATGGRWRRSGSIETSVSALSPRSCVLSPWPAMRAGFLACCLFDGAACFAGGVLGFALELLAGAAGLGARFAGGSPGLLLGAAFELFGFALRSLRSVAHCLLLCFWLL